MGPEPTNLTDKHVRAFSAGYTFDEAAAYNLLPDSDKRDQLRFALASRIHDLVTHRTGLHAFPTSPSVDDLIAYIDSNILAPNYAVTAAPASQEHVWRQGAWVCETRFNIVEKASGDDLTHQVDVDGTTFTAHTYWIAAYTFHVTP